MGGNIIAYFIVAMIVLWSCYVVLRRFMPKTSFKWQQALALGLNKKGFTRLSGWLMPKAAQSGCSAGCSDCSVDTTATKTACATDASTTNDVKEQPVQWR
ncbi:MAG: hypothetical protein EOO68_27350 [Moraxellaceae bacterium]|nr:MAG: hypothetical protein EOO68_27350 [Moraxellaceae bacterium]